MRANRRQKSICDRISFFYTQIHDYFFLKTLKVAFIGPAGSGKSSFVSPLFSNKYLSEMGSSEIRCQKTRLQNLKLIVYDIPGTGDFEAKWDHYYKKVDAIVFFIDSTASEEECKRAKDSLQGLLYRNMWLKKNLLILGTKNDLNEAMPCRELILRLNLLEIVDREVACYSVSAKTLTNIDLVEEWLIDQAEELSKN
ncbi:GTP-binding ADP-ribosylation factor-like protein [Pseudoloma neurophilia]|uniref:GTP-binding ADP-ribosylation factor-like protein n=1 Tax=Pseudoloma neurophilia TaxID=146866 RepID=A0A0R0M425_9MICR|nr:GTP-binding ADP-ribosylation factor-like protein [Pseudoloma neurophilia]